MSVSNEQIYELLTDIKGDVGEIKGTVAAHAGWMSAHVADDKAMGEEVTKIKLHLARQKGFLAAVATIGSLVGTGVGYAIDKLAH